MDPHVAVAFADIIRVAQSTFKEVQIAVDATPARAILRIQARYGLYRVFVTELVSVSARKYRYYVLRDNNVEAGFDNSPDPRALRLKYGRIGEAHAGELIPHLHLMNKSNLQLTEEISFMDFVDWLRQNLPPGDYSV